MIGNPKPQHPRDVRLQALKRKGETQIVIAHLSTREREKRESFGKFAPKV